MALFTWGASSVGCLMPFTEALQSPEKIRRDLIVVDASFLTNEELALDSTLWRHRRSIHVNASAHIKEQLMVAIVGSNGCHGKRSGHLAYCLPSNRNRVVAPIKPLRGEDD